VIVTFTLSAEAYVCLLPRIPRESTAYDCLVNAVRLDGRTDTPVQFFVTCDEVRAETIRNIAREHCPEAARIVEESLRAVRKSRAS
jgi:hypothetical protein